MDNRFRNLVSFIRISESGRRGITMAGHAITVDDEVFERLQREAQPLVDTPNSVLRRILKMDGPSGAGHRRRKPSLAPLLAKGLVHPGQRLTWQRRHLGVTYAAQVTEEGRMRLEDGAVCDSPSGACEAAARCKINGWDVWCTEDGTPLADLRARV
ncbi:hypothetical protein ACGFYF_04545 [Streptomyces lavendulae]|uniref:restriction system modified-DNA reader domain-containing protein n=1 Tax=Streptomyces lavendulae TaxID=1914 RepID=UPI0037162557